MTITIQIPEVLLLPFSPTQCHQLPVRIHQSIHCFLQNYIEPSISRDNIAPFLRASYAVRPSTFFCPPANPFSRRVYFQNPCFLIFTKSTMMNGVWSTVTRL